MLQGARRNAFAYRAGSHVRPLQHRVGHRLVVRRCPRQVELEDSPEVGGVLVGVLAGVAATLLALGPDHLELRLRRTDRDQAVGVLAGIENAIRDLKYEMGLNHLPSGKFAANGAWLAVQVMAHNLARWTARIGLGAGIVTTKTLRRRLFGLVGRLTRSARRFTLHLPARWPWAIGGSTALTRLRAIPLQA